MKEKVLTVMLCVIGLSAVSYGMIKENHLVFIMGLVCVIGGYLLIRKRLKESIRDRSFKNHL